MESVSRCYLGLEQLPRSLNAVDRPSMAACMTMRTSRSDDLTAPSEGGCFCPRLHARETGHHDLVAPVWLETCLFCLENLTSWFQSQPGLECLMCTCSVLRCFSLPCNMHFSTMYAWLETSWPELLGLDCRSSEAAMPLRCGLHCHKSQI